MPVKNQVSSVEAYREFLLAVKRTTFEIMETGVSAHEAINMANKTQLGLNFLWYPFSVIHEWNHAGLVNESDLAARLLRCTTNTQKGHTP